MGLKNKLISAAATCGILANIASLEGCADTRKELIFTIGCMAMAGNNNTGNMVLGAGAGAAKGAIGAAVESRYHNRYYRRHRHYYDY